MYRSILIPIDLDEPDSWKTVFATASSIADCFSAKVTICSVVSDAEAIRHGQWLPISVEERMFDARARLEGIAASGALPGCHVDVASGTIAGGILRVAEHVRADLIILASHQPGVGDYLKAANAIRVARRAPCSVLIARSTGPKSHA